MKTGIKLIFFCILINLATGLVMNLIPSFNEGDGSRRGGLSYNQQGFLDFSNSTTGVINPAGDLQDNTNVFNRLIDKVGLGTAKKILVMLDSYVYGFINLIQSVIPNLSSPWIIGLKGIMTILYALGAISLWTGKDIING